MPFERRRWTLGLLMDPSKFHQQRYLVALDLLAESSDQLPKRVLPCRPLWESHLPTRQHPQWCHEISHCIYANESTACRLPIFPFLQWAPSASSNDSCSLGCEGHRTANHDRSKTPCVHAWQISKKLRKDIVVPGPQEKKLFFKSVKRPPSRALQAFSRRSTKRSVLITRRLLTFSNSFSREPILLILLIVPEVSI